MRSLIVRVSIALSAGQWLLAPGQARAAPPAAPEPVEDSEVGSSEGGANPGDHPVPGNVAEVSKNPAESEATALFELGYERMEQADYAEACPLFEQSLRLARGVGTQFHLASCYEQQGKKAKAHTLFLQVADVTLQAGQLDRHEAARKRAEALEVELGSLRIQVAGASTALTIRIDEEEFAASELRDQFFVDPGEHEVIARAPKKVKWSKLVSVEAAEVVTVEIPELRSEKSEPEPEPELELELELEPAAVTNSDEPSFTWVPPVALGVGAVGLFAGLAFTQQYRSSNEDAENVCPSSHACTPDEIDRHDELVDDARVARTRAYIGYGVALAGLVGGVVYYAVRPRSASESARRSIHVGAAVAADSVGGVAYGTF